VKTNSKGELGEKLSGFGPEETRKSRGLYPEEMFNFNRGRANIPNLKNHQRGGRRKDPEECRIRKRMGRWHFERPGGGERIKQGVGLGWVRGEKILSLSQGGDFLPGPGTLNGDGERSGGIQGMD